MGLSATRGGGYTLGHKDITLLDSLKLLICGVFSFLKKYNTHHNPQPLWVAYLEKVVSCILYPVPSGPRPGRGPATIIEPLTPRPGRDKESLEILGFVPSICRILR